MFCCTAFNGILKIPVNCKYLYKNSKIKHYLNSLLHNVYFGNGKVLFNCLKLLLEINNKLYKFKPR